jgi:hypothetical protein
MQMENKESLDSAKYPVPAAPLGPPLLVSLVDIGDLQGLDRVLTPSASWGSLPSAEEAQWVREKAFSREERRAIKKVLSGEDAFGRLRLLSIHFLNNATVGRLPLDLSDSSPLVTIIFNFLQTRIRSVLPHLEDALLHLQVTDPLLTTALQNLWATVEMAQAPSVQGCNAMVDQLQTLQNRLLPLVHALPGPSDRITDAVIRVIGTRGLPLADRRSPPGGWLEAA